MTRWCRHRKSKVRGYWLKKPFDHVFIGCDPRDGMTKKAADSFDAYVNVSDSECNYLDPSRSGQFMHWYPVNEMGRWNLGYLYWLKKVLDFHHEKRSKVYLHCHAGAYRSPSAAILWLHSRGISPAKARHIVGERSPAIYRLWEGHGNIHPLKHEMFKVMRKHPTWSFSSVAFKACDHEYGWDHELAGGDMRWRHNVQKYLFFYYRPKWWLRENWRDFKNWAFERLGYYRSGPGTWYYKRKHFWVKPRDAEPIDGYAVWDRFWSPTRRKWVKRRKK